MTMTQIIAVQAMITKIKEHLLQIRTIYIENDGEAIFDIVPSFAPNNTPVIYFDRDFLDIRLLKRDNR